MSFFKDDIKLEKFPFPDGMLSCRNRGIFPDLAIKLNTDNEMFTGGEFIELKDAKSFTISSFNSTIPLGRKKVKEVTGSKKSRIWKQMEEAGDDILSLEIRDVYYLVRGRKDSKVKVCLTHGSFFRNNQ